MGLFGRKKTTDPLPGPDAAAMDPLDVMRQARALVMPSDFLPADTLASSFRYHREVADDLIALIAVAHSDSATFITDDDSSHVSIRRRSGRLRCNRCSTSRSRR